MTIKICSYELNHCVECRFIRQANRGTPNGVVTQYFCGLMNNRLLEELSNQQFLPSYIPASIPIWCPLPDKGGF